MALWKIILYTTATGASPVADFIDRLDATAQAKIVNTMHLLREYNVRLGGAHAKKLAGTDIWEIRILGGDSIRIFYVAIERQTFLLLHGFKKKTFKTPARELKVASERLHEYRARNEA